MNHRMPSRRLVSVAIAPALMTLGNLLCGFMAVFWASRPGEVVVLGHFHPLMLAAALVFGGMIFDALDGAVARLVRSTSSFGAQLDSMADMMTFGVAPAFIVIQLNDVGAPFFTAGTLDTYFGRLVLLIAAAYAACCGLRLARFTVEAAPQRAPDHAVFTGLPSPGAAGTVCGLVLVYLSLVGETPAVATRAVGFAIVGVLLLAALAMVSQLPYPHAVNRWLRGRRPFWYVAMLVVGAILLLTVPVYSVAAGFAVYALLPPVGWAVGRLRGRRGGEEGVAPVHDRTRVSPWVEDRQETEEERTTGRLR